jgi:CRP-like cAMP-binding protein
MHESPNKNPAMINPVTTNPTPASSIPASSTTAKRLNLLRQIELFADVKDADLVLLLADFRLREFKKDEPLFHQGDESREIYFVIKGKVRIYKTTPGGNETSIAIFAEHDIIGELAALDNLPRSATARAMTPAALLTMSQERFIHHLRSVPGMALGLCRILAQKQRWTAAYAESIAQFDAAGRLLHIILLNNERYGKAIEPGKSYTIEIGLNQTDLASMVGARREWVNRILNDWRRRGLLEMENGVVTIWDLPRVIAERDSRLEMHESQSDAW